MEYRHTQAHLIYAQHTPNTAQPILLFDYVFLFASTQYSLAFTSHFGRFFIYKWWNSIKRIKLKTNQMRFPLWLKYTRCFFFLTSTSHLPLIWLTFFSAFEMLFCVVRVIQKRIYRWTKWYCGPHKNVCWAGISALITLIWIHWNCFSSFCCFASNMGFEKEKHDSFSDSATVNFMFFRPINVKSSKLIDMP